MSFNLPARVREAALTIHILLSVGWVGAVLSFFAIAVMGLQATYLPDASSLYRSLEVLSWWILVPLSVFSLLSGIIQAVLTPCVLVRHR
jgi:hypothetical protein